MNFFKIFIFLLSINFCKITYAQDHDNYIARIAVVDVESILEHSLAVMNIKKSINELSENIHKEISNKEKEFKKYEQELVGLQKTLVKEEFDILVAKFNKNVSNVQKDIQIRKLALEQAHSAAIQTVHDTTINIINNLAKRDNFNIVLPSTQVLFVTKELNITLEVISNLNENLKEVSIDYEKFLK